MGNGLNLDGAKIRALRIQRGWTQEQLAEIAGISSRTVQRAEKADCAAFETVRAVASAFGGGFDELLKVETRESPAPEIVQPPPAPVQLPGPNEPNSAKRTVLPLRRKPTTTQVAAAALAAGMLAGAIFTYRYGEHLRPHPSAPQVSLATPSQTDVWNKAAQSGTGTGRASSVLRAVAQPLTGVAADRKAAVVDGRPGNYGSVAQTGEIFEPADAPTRTVITSLSQPAACDLPLPSRALRTTVAFPEAPLARSALSALPGYLAQNDEDTGAVRQATGQATKKAGEFVARVGASIKRAF